MLKMIEVTQRWNQCIFASWFRMRFCSFPYLFSDSTDWKELNPVMLFGLLSLTFFSNNFSFLNFLFNDHFSKRSKIKCFYIFWFSKLDGVGVCRDKQVLNMKLHVIFWLTSKQRQHVRQKIKFLLMFLMQNPS